jgi:hypothetical protein
MIKDNELRLDNWVIKDGEPHQISYGDFASSYDFSKLDPIPLTPEILLKCGFTWRNDSHNIMDFGRFVLFLDNSFRYKDYPYTKVKTLHHAQNLCYALTGKEITINL